jgi:hypothetical protein
VSQPVDADGDRRHSERRQAMDLSKGKLVETIAGKRDRDDNERSPTRLSTGWSPSWATIHCASPALGTGFCKGTVDNGAQREGERPTFYSAPVGRQDDLVMAFALCVFGCRRLGIGPEAEVLIPKKSDCL